MEPGWANFHRVRRGALLARDRSGAVLAPCRGLVLLPRYQGQGNDGFFVARPVRRFWLGVSSLLRRLGAERLLPVLPGVRRIPGDRTELLVDPRVARWLAVPVFHLFGYRRKKPVGPYLSFRRRS
jgi:succinylglutamate desuccinylase